MSKSSIVCMEKPELLNTLSWAKPSSCNVLPIIWMHTEGTLRDKSYIQKYIPFLYIQIKGIYRNVSTKFRTSLEVFWLLLLVLSHVWLLVTPWTTALQASWSFTISWSLLRFTSIESVMLSSCLILPSPSPSALNLFQYQGFFPVSQLFASSVFKYK